MKSGLARYTYITSLIVTLLALLLSVSCLGPGYEISDSESGNKSFTMKRGISRFSFEYPSYYEINSVDIYNEFASIDLIVPSSNTEGRDIALLGVSVIGKVASPDAETAIREAIERAQREYNFKLTDESSIAVAGVKGYQFSCAYEILWPPEYNREPAPEFQRQVYFDHSGLIWNITLISGERSPETNQDFEQVLRTFKVLN